jgi:hypothetical protein
LAPTVSRRRSLRNYVSVAEAADGLLACAERRISGTLQLAGASTVDTGTFVRLLADLPGSRLVVRWQDDGGEDRCEYETSPALTSIPQPVETALRRAWEAKPGWLAAV